MLIILFFCVIDVRIKHSLTPCPYLRHLTSTFFFFFAFLVGFVPQVHQIHGRLRKKWWWWWWWWTVIEADGHVSMTCHSFLGQGKGKVLMCLCNMRALVGSFFRPAGRVQNM
ncbi:hypothetical protein QBC41DRAFT_20550 [Cercophora samala]|uniref:Uncharacterized protein n=1 Tax=Cercophora samala TaxID=330535 RepID=A0AA39Z6B4_9PEZI|nr:hypothetical protein QBC41DRAFT_20550 [Cercophora samala]